MINYQNLHESTIFYEKLGFKRIESPWTVTQDVSKITKPKGKIDWEIKHNNKVLVASAEQSFLYLYLKGFLPMGRFQSITPCFRYETFDRLHTKYFMKNELIVTNDVSEKMLMSVIKCAQEFFCRILNVPYSPVDCQVEIVITEAFENKDLKSADLVYKGIELGSYGIRSCEYLTWIYGTGCAEPRLSFCQKLNTI